jgi:CheY-like chemotaxis protein
MPPSAKVYVIDDDPAMRDSLDFLLGSAGFNVRLFDSALAFLNELATAGGRLCGHGRAHAGHRRHGTAASVEFGPAKASGHCHDRSWS